MKTYYLLIMLANFKGAFSGIMFNGNGTEFERVGGDPIEITLAPYIVVMTEVEEDFDSFRCAGVLYKPDLVITTAHCVLTKSLEETLNPTGMRVYAGSSSLYNISEYREIEYFKAHEDYNQHTGVHNVGVVKLKSEFNIDENIRTISLSTGSFDAQLERSTTAEGAPCVITGWGCNTIGGLPIDELRQAEVTVYDRVRCTKEYTEKLGEVVKPHETFICLSSEAPKYTCLMDPGGPLVCDGILVGIFLFSEGCGDKVSLPIVCTQLFAYEDWINGPPNSAVLSKASLESIIYSIILQLSGVIFYRFD